MKGDHHFSLGIEGHRWLWRYSPLKGKADGWTEFAAHKVLIDSRLDGRARLETELHEGLHASIGPAVSEAAVTQAAADLARVLWSLGYRIPSQ